jgi:arylsulfatase A-like enzyme
MDEKTLTKEHSPELTRRDFFGALSAAAAAGVVAAESAQGQTGFPLYQDSFGNIAPAAGDALNVGVYPPPIYNGGSGPATVTPGYAQPNILMIMVDQLRSPRWLPVGGQAAIDQMTPNLAYLRNHSFVFPNYFVAATDCTPCRATLLTGLYSQQTYMFKTQVSTSEPNLQTGFPTFGGALAQQAGYETCWIGKWHLSDFAPGQTEAGSNGAGDYGFTAASQNLPSSSSLANPVGAANEGTDGYNGAPFGSGTPNPGDPVPGMAPLPYPLINDAAIANWFINKWVPSAPTTQPWFCCVSFVNPHDMTDFPYAFGLSGTTNFGKPTAPPADGYQPPPTAGYPYNSSQPDQFVPALNASLYPPGGTPPAQWNQSDDPVTQPYGQLKNGSWGKPGLQAYFENVVNYQYGSILNTNGWFTFLNYYFWMQACVDYQIGRVTSSLQGSPFWSNTIIIFTSDHGDYGGSHNMHMKGGGLYDEIMNVPLYVSFPNMRPPFALTNTSRIRPYVCSSVDIFPFLYTLALGNSGWRNNPNDPYSYLSGREAILDAILSTSPQQRRISAIPNSSGVGMQPYIIHTQDEYPTASIWGTKTTQPSHAIAYRTVDTSVTMTVGGVTFYGGAKLGIYSYWPCGATTPDLTQAQQFEFYNYTAGNVGETGNSAFSAANTMASLAQSYLTDYTNKAQNELYASFPQVQSVAETALTAYLTYIAPTINCPAPAKV